MRSNLYEEDNGTSKDRKKFSLVKIIIISIICAVLIVTGCFAFLEKVDAGYVGVQYSYNGGVKKEVLSPGLNPVSPFVKVKQFPTAQQQLVLSNNASDFNEKELEKDTHVDAPANGGMVKLNMSVNYTFDPEKIVDLYEKFKGMDGETLVESRVKNQIIAYIKEVTPQFTVMDIYSDKRSEVSSTITDYLNEKLESQYGIKIVNALIIDVQLDDELMTKVKAKEQAKQDAEKAELDKQTAIAQGEADKAKAEANKAVTITNAQAEAESNRIVSESITDELIKMTEAEARKEHGWVTVQGADKTVVDATDK